MTSETETKIPVTDLTRVSVSCRKCGAEATVDFADERQSRAWTENKAFRCAVCQDDFGKGVKDALTALRDAVKSAHASGTEMIMRLRHA